MVDMCRESLTLPMNDQEKILLVCMLFDLFGCVLFGHD